MTDCNLPNLITSDKKLIAHYVTRLKSNHSWTINSLQHRNLNYELRHVDRPHDTRSKRASRQHHTPTQHITEEILWRSKYVISNTSTSTSRKSKYLTTICRKYNVTCINLVFWCESKQPLVCDTSSSSRCKLQLHNHVPLPVKTFRVSKKGRFYRYVTTNSMSFELFGKVRWNTQWEAHQWRNSAVAPDQASWPVNDSHAIDNQILIHSRTNKEVLDNLHNPNTLIIPNIIVLARYTGVLTRQQRWRSAHAQCAVAPRPRLPSLESRSGRTLGQISYSYFCS